MSKEELLALEWQTDDRSILDMLEELEGIASELDGEMEQMQWDMETVYDLISEIRNRIAPAGDDVSNK